MGADGILLLEETSNGADFRMRYYNRDGGEAEEIAGIADRLPDLPAPEPPRMEG